MDGRKILLSLGGELGGIIRIVAFMQLVEVGMVVGEYLRAATAHEEHRYAGALVCRTAHMGKGFDEHKAGAYSAGAVLQADDMPVLQRGNHLVDNLLKGLYLLCHILILGGEGGNGGVNYFKKGIGHEGKFLPCGFGEGKAFLHKALAELVYAGGVVAYALKVGYRLQQQVQIIGILI